MNEHGVAAFGDFVGPGDAAVVVLLMRGDDRQRLVVDAGDFPPAEELVAAVIVQGEDAPAAAPGPGRLQEDRFGPRAAGKLPGETLDVQAVKSCVASTRTSGLPPRSTGAMHSQTRCRAAGATHRAFSICRCETRAGRGRRPELFPTARGHRPDHVLAHLSSRALRFLRARDRDHFQARGGRRRRK